MVEESGYTLDDIKNEIKKCKIVCINCHNNIHSCTRDECINALEYVAEKLGKSPTTSEYHECRRDTDPSSSSIIRCFNSWNDAKEAAGLKTFEDISEKETGLEPEPEPEDEAGLVIEGQSKLGNF